MHKSPLGVAKLGPWVGEHQKQPVQAVIRQGADELARVVIVETEIAGQGAVDFGIVWHQSGQQ